MTRKDFVDRLRSGSSEGTVLQNPGGGTTTIIWYDDERLCYQRGGSRFYVSLDDLFRAYSTFQGSHVTTRKLKDFAPSVFDSTAGGHNCNATVLLLALNRMGLGSPLWGSGRRGSPFGVTLND